MRILVAVPSRGRSKTIFKRTLRWVGRTGFVVKVFVEPQEIEQYRAGIEDANYRYYLDLKPDMFVDIGENDKGLGFAKSFIKKYAEENNFDLVFKMDDDVLRFNQQGKNKDDDRMVINFATMVGQCRVVFGRYKDLAAIGFPYRNELFGKDLKLWPAINQRLQSCYIIRTEYLQGGFDTFEDQAQFIYIRSLNKVTLRYGLMGIDCAAVGKEKGGLQLFDRKRLAEEELKRLRDIYPALEVEPTPHKPWPFEPSFKGEFFGYKAL